MHSYGRILTGYLATNHLLLVDGDDYSLDVSRSEVSLGLPFSTRVEQVSGEGGSSVLSKLAIAIVARFFLYRKHAPIPSLACVRYLNYVIFLQKHRL